MSACGYLDLEEPFDGLFTQGMIGHETYQGPDGAWLSPAEVTRAGEGAYQSLDGTPVRLGRVEKMSKSKKNTIDPEEIIGTYGADTARWFMLSDSPPDRDMEWTDAGVEGAFRFVNRLWRLIAGSIELLGEEGAAPAAAAGAALELRRGLHRTIVAFTADLEQFHFNRAVARIYELANAVTGFLGSAGSFTAADRAVLREAFETITRLIGPMMPHLAEELWLRLAPASRRGALLADQPWPEADPALTVEDQATVAVQVNGKLRATITVARDAAEETLRDAALAEPKVRRAIADKAVRKLIVVRNRIVNVVV